MPLDRQTVVLVKTTAVFGRLRPGTRDETKHPAELDREAAAARAFRMLKRSNPDENPMEWAVEEEEETPQ